MRPSKGYSPTSGPRRGEKSGHEKSAQRGALTSCRAQKEVQVRTWKECEPVSGTHQLEIPDGGTGQDTECEQKIVESAGEEISPC